MPLSNDDDTLLARLNALKKSPISLSNAPITPSSTSPSSLPSIQQPDDDLAARFRRLGNPTAKDSNASAPAIAPGAASYLEGVAEGLGGDAEQNEEDEKSLEELLKELGPGAKWDISGKEEVEVGKLVQEVRNIVPEVKDGGKKWDSKRENSELIGEAREEHEQDVRDEDEDTLDEQDADEYIAQVLAKLELRKKYGKQEEDNSASESDDGSEDGQNISTSREKRTSKDQAKPEESSKGSTQESADMEEEPGPALDLPAPPSTIPVTPPAAEEDDFDRATAIEDALTARLNALSLPSAPSFSPSKKPIKVTKAKAKTHFTDEEIDSWCIICNDDAAVKCIGCDGDLYCRQCWQEGHIGESAGFEERKHRWVKYEKKKG
ncbi:hypothetical protein AOQ84DRAFT_121172 [Glonium stellatum]|uniref:Abscission/NoCut checkpoint regulator n=1 Tax=Glonium stellatum TaxID=574774 RepID=A0A8E2JZG1_9PEZI|nr:hypothetical protein AOQ84DRAFT_121172 [Glonium stellatum]